MSITCKTILSTYMYILVDTYGYMCMLNERPNLASQISRKLGIIDRKLEGAIAYFIVNLQLIGISKMK